MKAAAFHPAESWRMTRLFNGYLAQQIVVGFSTYAYTNGLLYTHTDERGLTTTDSWDSLQRLTNATHPNSTAISCVYSNMDLVQMVDRMGFRTSYLYKTIRKKIA